MLFPQSSRFSRMFCFRMGLQVLLAQRTLVWLPELPNKRAPLVEDDEVRKCGKQETAGRGQVRQNVIQIPHLEYMEIPISANTHHTPRHLAVVLLNSHNTRFTCSVFSTVATCQDTSVSAAPDGRGRTVITASCLPESARRTCSRNRDGPRADPWRNPTSRGPGVRPAPVRPQMGDRSVGHGGRA